METAWPRPDPRPAARLPAHERVPRRPRPARGRLGRGLRRRAARRRARPTPRRAPPRRLRRAGRGRADARGRAHSLGRPATVFTGSRPHTPCEVVDAGAAIARAARADAIVAVGGSAAVDCAKGIGVLLATGIPRVARLEPLDFRNLFAGGAAGAAVPTRLPLLAITTTLSFAEFLPFWGARDAEARRKRPYPDRGCLERTIFLDGALAAHTPDAPWLETGVKALDDALSAWCRATGPEPFLDPLLARSPS
ncbi:MAG: iron-containing alcohol dehydrogenase [Myxococcota bacterium]